MENEQHSASPLDITVMREPLTERQIVDCIVRAGCLGTVKMSYDSGPYEITRTSINADRLVKEIERAHGIGLVHNAKLTGGGAND